MFDRFTDRGRKVMGLSKAEAQRLHHEYIGTEHILLGLVKEGSGVAANVLKQMNIDLERIRSEIEKIVKGSPKMVTQGNLPFTPRAKRVLELAVEEASNLGHNYIGTEHLLLGLIKENEGIAARVLLNLGVKLSEVREEVLEFLGVDKSSYGIARFDVSDENVDRFSGATSSARTRALLDLHQARVARDDPAAIPPLLIRRSDLRIGVVGSGSTVLNAHLPAYAKWGLRVTAITDVRSEAAEDAARRYGIGNVCSGIDELLTSPDVDVIDVAVTEFERHRLLPKLLKVGKPVLLRKPLAESLPEAWKIVDDFARAKIPLAVNQNLRWSPEMQAAKHLIAGGHLGQVFDLRWTMRSTADRRASAMGTGYGERKRFQVLNVSEHPLDAFRFLLEDEAVRVYCALPRRPDQNFKGDVCATAVIRFRRGVHASLVDSNASTPGRPDTQVLDVDGTGGSLTFGLATPRYFAYWLAKEIPGGGSGDGDAPAHAPPLTGDWFPDGFAGSMASFLEAVEAGTEAPTSGRRNLGTMALVDACYRSAESGEAVDVPLVD
jgi:predicted dehydrogenase